MKSRDYNVICQYPDGYISRELYTFEGYKDQSELAIKHCLTFHKEYNPEFIPSILGVELLSQENIEWQLLKDMQAIRAMCDLGRKIRAMSNLPLRQPLETVYIYFSDYVTRLNSYNKFFATIINEELNVSNIVFIDNVRDNKLFDAVIKPNFKSLGPKGHGKVAQGLKKIFESLSINQSNDIYSRLLLGVVSDFKIPLSLEDIEISLKPKNGLNSFTNDYGACILDIKVTHFLKKKGIVYNIKSYIQNIRKLINLGLQDKISIEVISSNQEILDAIKSFDYFLIRECIINNISYKLSENVLQFDKDLFSYVYENDIIYLSV